LLPAAFAACSRFSLQAAGSGQLNDRTLRSFAFGAEVLGLTNSGA
jgi:hypothetical protein